MNWPSRAALATGGAAVRDWIRMLLPGPAVEDVLPRPADQDVVAGAAEQRVVAGAADQDVVAVAAVGGELHAR